MTCPICDSEDTDPLSDAGWYRCNNCGTDFNADRAWTDDDFIVIYDSRWEDDR